MKSFKRLVSIGLILGITLAGVPSVASARLITTEELSSMGVDPSDRNHVNNYLNRSEVRQALLAQGVQPEAALERVQAMSDAEVHQLAGRIDQAPAGGDILGLLFTVFIVLLVTDIMGLTKVFPFTRSVR